MQKLKSVEGAGDFYSRKNSIPLTVKIKIKA